MSHQMRVECDIVGCVTPPVEIPHGYVGAPDDKLLEGWLILSFPPTRYCESVHICPKCRKLFKEHIK